MLYTVFLWKQITSSEAEIVETIDMPNAEAAVFEVMAAHGLPYAYYAYASPEDENLSTTDFYDLHCPGVGSAGH